MAGPMSSENRTDGAEIFYDLAPNLFDPIEVVAENRRQLTGYAFGRER